MRLSRANIPLASEDRTYSQAISPSPHYNLAPHFWPGFINLQHFCHSQWRNPVRLSKSGLDGKNRKTRLRHEVGGRSQVRSGFYDPLRPHGGNNFAKQRLAHGLSIEWAAPSAAV